MCGVSVPFYLFLTRNLRKNFRPFLIPAEKCSYRSIKKGNMFKAKTLIEKTGTRYLKQGDLITSADNSWPPPLPFHTALKIPQPNIFTIFIHVSVCMSVCVCVCVCVNESVCEYVCLSMWVSVFIRVRHVGKLWIYSAEEFLERMER